MLPRVRYVSAKQSTLYPAHTAAYWTQQRIAGRDAWCREALRRLCDGADAHAATVLRAQASAFRGARRGAHRGARYSLGEVSHTKCSAALAALDAALQHIVTLLRSHRVCELTTSRRPACAVRATLAAVRRAATVSLSRSSTLNAPLATLRRALHGALLTIRECELMPPDAVLSPTNVLQLCLGSRSAAAIAAANSAHDCCVIASSLERAAALRPPPLASLITAATDTTLDGGAAGTAATTRPPAASGLREEVKAYRKRASALMHRLVDDVVAECAIAERRGHGSTPAASIFTPAARSGLLARAHTMFHRYFGELLRRQRLRGDGRREARFVELATGHSLPLAADPLAAFALRCGDRVTARAVWVAPLVPPRREDELNEADAAALLDHFSGSSPKSSRSRSTKTATRGGTTTTGRAGSAMGEALAFIHDPLLVAAAAVMLATKVFVGIGLTPQLFARKMWRARFGGSSSSGEGAAVSAPPPALAVTTWTRRLVLVEEAMLTALDFDLGLDTVEAALPAACRELLGGGALLRLHPTCAAHPVAHALARGDPPMIAAAARLMLPAASAALVRVQHLPLCMSHSVIELARAAAVRAASEVGLLGVDGASEQVLRCIGANLSAHSQLAGGSKEVERGGALSGGRESGEKVRVDLLQRRWDARCQGWLLRASAIVAVEAVATAVAATNAACAAALRAENVTADAEGVLVLQQQLHAAWVASSAAAAAAKAAARSARVAARAKAACVLIGLAAHSATVAIRAADAAKAAARLAERSAAKAEAKRRGEALRKRRAAALAEEEEMGGSAPASKRSRSSRTRRHNARLTDEEALQLAIEASLGDDAPTSCGGGVSAQAAASATTSGSSSGSAPVVRTRPPKPKRRQRSAAAVAAIDATLHSVLERARVAPPKPPRR